MCCLYFSSIIAVSLWLYRVSAAQDVVQQLILRLIHFLLNCPQTQAVIQPVLVNPRPCVTHMTLKRRQERETLSLSIKFSSIKMTFVLELCVNSGEEALMLLGTQFFHKLLLTCNQKAS